MSWYLIWEKSALKCEKMPQRTTPTPYFVRRTSEKMVLKIKYADKNVLSCFSFVFMSVFLNLYQKLNVLNKFIYVFVIN